jgi:hypothetical protein
MGFQRFASSQQQADAVGLRWRTPDLDAGVLLLAEIERRLGIVDGSGAASKIRMIQPPCATRWPR